MAKYSNFEQKQDGNFSIKLHSKLVDFILRVQLKKIIRSMKKKNILPKNTTITANIYSDIQIGGADNE